MIDLALVIKNMLHYVQDEGAVGGMGRGLSDHHIVLCKVMLVGTWIEGRGRRIRRDKLREHQ